MSPWRDGRAVNGESIPSNSWKSTIPKVGSAGRAKSSRRKFVRAICGHEGWSIITSLRRYVSCPGFLLDSTRLKGGRVTSGPWLPSITSEDGGLQSEDSINPVPRQSLIWRPPMFPPAIFLGARKEVLADRKQRGRANQTREVAQKPTPWRTRVHCDWGEVPSGSLSTRECRTGWGAWRLIVWFLGYGRVEGGKKKKNI